jgi:hypothetical protein
MDESARWMRLSLVDERDVKGMAIKVSNHYSINILICFSLYVIGCVFVYVLRAFWFDQSHSCIFFAF